MKQALASFLKPNGGKIALFVVLIIVAYSLYSITLGPCDVTGRLAPAICSSILLNGAFWIVFGIAFGGLMVMNNIFLEIPWQVGMFLGGFFVAFLSFFYWYILGCLFYGAIRKLKQISTQEVSKV